MWNLESDNLIQKMLAFYWNFIKLKQWLMKDWHFILTLSLLFKIVVLFAFVWAFFLPLHQF